MKEKTLTYPTPWLRQVTKFIDHYGYTVEAGTILQVVTDPAKVGPTLSIKAWREDGIVTPKSSFHGSTPLAEKWVQSLQPLGEEESAKFLARLEATKRTNPENFVYLLSGMTMGSDPEVFVEGGNGKILPAFEFLGPESKVPYNKDLDRDSTPAPYWDGFQAEFKVKPWSCIEEGTFRIQRQLVQVLNATRAVDPKSTIVAKDTMPIPARVLNGAEEIHVALGCAPSENAYGMAGDRIREPREIPWRFAGMHVHLSLKPEQRPLIPQIVKSIDQIAGVMSVAVLDGLENPIRRRYYGLAGEYRVPSYGVEYRTLSSAVLCHPAMNHLHMNMVRVGAQMALANFNVWEGSEDETISIINNCDVDGARKVLTRNKSLMCGLLNYLYIKNRNNLIKPEDLFDRLLMHGVRQHIPMDVVTNWHLTGTFREYGREPGCQMWDFAQQICRKPSVSVAR